MQTESITIHATKEDIPLPAAHLREFLTANQITDTVINICEKALNELLKQIVEHAYQGDENQLIMVNISYNKSGIYIETQDQGMPIDFAVNKRIPAKNLQPASSEEPPPVQTDMLDEVWYEVDMGKNIWQLVKYL
jgi:anti-sigma regulatory factor (Ser/Thr protein kinase)